MHRLPGSRRPRASGERGSGLRDEQRSNVARSRVCLYTLEAVESAVDVDAVASSRSTNSSISADRASAKFRSVAITRKPHFSRTRRDATLSDATRAGSGRARSTLKKASRASVAIPFAPVGAADPVRDLALAAVTPGPDRSGDLAVDDDNPGEHRFVGS
jgi:hypothetical protein